MKGITPIIAIIILLLITISLAAAAWTFLTGYFTGLTTGTIELSQPTCLSGTIPFAVVKNIGTSTISVSDISVDTGSTIVPANLDWRTANGAITSTIPGDNGIAQLKIYSDAGHTTGDCAAGSRCAYIVLISGRQFETSVRC